MDGSRMLQEPYDKEIAEFGLQAPVSSFKTRILACQGGRGLRSH